MSHDNNNHNDKWYSPKAQEWHYHLQKDPEYLEREYHTDRIKWYNDRIDIDVWSSMIEEFELLYEQVPVKFVNLANVALMVQAQIHRGRRRKKEAAETRTRTRTT